MEHGLNHRSDHECVRIYECCLANTVSLSAVLAVVVQGGAVMPTQVFKL